MLWGRLLIKGGTTIAYNAVFCGGYYSREATKQRWRLLEEIRYVVKMDMDMVNIRQSKALKYKLYMHTITFGTKQVMVVYFESCNC